MPRPQSRDDDLLRPAEVAKMFGVRPKTIARWAREGRLAAVTTPGGHRRYLVRDVRRALAVPDRAAEEERAADAVRLYEEGWTIRQVADRFEVTYGVMRRILQRKTRLRDRGGADTPARASTPSAERDP